MTASAKQSASAATAAQTDIRGIWLSQKGIDYVLHPKRGAFNLINPDVASTVTAKGQNNWIGTFVSPNIDHVVHETKLGGATPTVIYMKDGRVIIFDGTEYRDRD